MPIRMWKPRKILGSPVYSLVIASYLIEDPRRIESLLCLIYSMRAQTYRHWELVIMHDGPCPPEIVNRVVCLMDDRVKFVTTPTRKAKFGHPWRQRGFELASGTYIGAGNDDNYYCPVFVEWMLYELISKKADLAYCDMIHSHKQWKFFPTTPRRGMIDLGAWVATKDLVRSVPWTGDGFDADGHYVEALKNRAQKNGHNRVIKIPACLFVHN